LEAGAEVETAIGIVIATETEITTGIKIETETETGIATGIRIVTGIAAAELAFTRTLISRASDSAWIKANV